MTTQSEKSSLTKRIKKFQVELAFFIGKRHLYTGEALTRCESIIQILTKNIDNLTEQREALNSHKTCSCVGCKNPAKYEAKHLCGAQYGTVTYYCEKHSFPWMAANSSKFYDVKPVKC
jgi:hypothetical protein